MPDIDKNEVLRDMLSGLNADVPPMPEELHASWMQKVEEDMTEKQTENRLNRKAITRFLSIAAALVFVVGGTLLTRDDLSPAENSAQYVGSAESSGAPVLYADSAEEYDAELGAYDAGSAYSYGFTTASTVSGAAPDTAFTRSAAVPAAGEGDTPTAKAVPEEKKIIRTASLTIVTQEYDLSLSCIRAQCETAGGWVESSSESLNSRTGLRTVRLTLRIPQEELDTFLSGASGYGRITSRTETATDVTASYQDTQARLNTQLALMDRLQALVPQAETLPDLLALESQIADTQYNIDTLTSSLANTDRQVAYATVSITLQEETAPSLTDTSVSLSERLLAGLRVGCEAVLDFAVDMLVFLAAALPFLAIIAIIALALLIIRRIRRRNKK